MSNAAEYSIICNKVDSLIIGCMIYNERNTIQYVQMQLAFSDTKVSSTHNITMYLVPVNFKILSLRFNNTHMVVFAQQIVSSESYLLSFKFFVFNLLVERPENFPVFSFNATMLFEKAECFDPNLAFRFNGEYMVVSTGSSIKGCDEMLIKAIELDGYYLQNTCRTVECLKRYTLALGDEFSTYPYRLDKIIDHTGYITEREASVSKANPYLLSLTVLAIIAVLLKAKSLHDKRQQDLDNMMRMGSDSMAMSTRESTVGLSLDYGRVNDLISLHQYED